jgi:hypothetical protein
MVLALATAAAVVVLRQRSGDIPSADGVAPRPPSASTGDRPAAAADARTRGVVQLLRRLSTRLERGSRGSVRSLAAPGDRPAARELDALHHNVRALRMTSLSLRLVGTDDRAAGAAGSDTWTSAVQVRWRLAADGAAASSVRVPVRFRQLPRAAGSGGIRFVTARSAGRGAVPLWILGRVFVARTLRSVVVSADPGRRRTFAALADRAVLGVRRVLPRWSGRLVVEVPRDERQLDRILDAASGTYASTAAVTTTADGSTSQRAPQHVVVNPRVFDPLGSRASQFVMTHEATHVAMRATLSTMPLWLVEGFADHVALRQFDVPVSRFAGRTLARVRRSGPPDRLPTDDDFGRRRPQLGGAYESALLACRLIAKRYGERRLVAFYRASDRAGGTAGAFRTVLGTDEQAFTRTWRADLRRLARSTAG